YSSVRLLGLGEENQQGQRRSAVRAAADRAGASFGRGFLRSNDAPEAASRLTAEPGRPVQSGRKAHVGHVIRRPSDTITIFISDEYSRFLSVRMSSERGV